MSYPSLDSDSSDQYETLTEILFKRHSLLSPGYDSILPDPITRVAEATTAFLRRVPLLGGLIPATSEKETQVRLLQAQQKAASTYSAWLETSTQLDLLLGIDAWKQDPRSDYYDYGLVAARLDQLREARASDDHTKLLYLVRTTFIRNLGNINNVNLYRTSHVGTKTLIEEYISECEQCVEFLASGHARVDQAYVLQMLLQTRKNIGRTALVLSGGGCFGLIHIGVLSTLMESNLLPRIVSGLSAGLIVASILCSNTNDDLRLILLEIGQLEIPIFDNSEETVWMKLSRFLKYGTWFDNANLQQTMYEFLGDLTFRESYNRTGRILNITVSPASIHEQSRLLNYLTAPSVLIWSAVCASCALPGVFASSTVYEKVPRTGVIQEWNGATSVKYVDGSVDNDLPITRLSEMFNVGHIIACQVNPHVSPLLKMSISCVGGDVETEYSAWLKQTASTVYSLMSLELIHYLAVAKELGIARNLCTKATSILEQTYSGDITILPELHLLELSRLLQNPNPAFFLECTVRGARATWPKMTIIRNHCAIEFALDRSISRLRSRLISNRSTLFNSPYTLVSSPVMLSLPTEEPHHAQRLLTNSRSSTALSLRTRAGSVGFDRRRSLSSIHLPGLPKKLPKPVARHKSQEEDETPRLKRRTARRTLTDTPHALTRKISFETPLERKSLSRKPSFEAPKQRRTSTSGAEELMRRDLGDTGYSAPRLGFDRKTSGYANGYLVAPTTAYLPRSRMHSRRGSIEHVLVTDTHRHALQSNVPTSDDPFVSFQAVPGTRVAALTQEPRYLARSGLMTFPSVSNTHSRNRSSLSVGERIRVARGDNSPELTVNGEELAERITELLLSQHMPSEKTHDGSGGELPLGHTTPTEVTFSLEPERGGAYGEYDVYS